MVFQSIGLKRYDCTVKQDENDPQYDAIRYIAEKVAHNQYAMDKQHDQQNKHENVVG